MHRQKGNAAVWIIIILVIIAGVWYFMRRNDSTVTPSTNTQTQENATGSDFTPAPGVSTSTIATSTSAKVVTINYTSAGFDPKSVTIRKGDSVTWVNKSGHNMWIASASHPTHTVYDGTSLSQHCGATTSDSFDQCQSGNSYTFKFDKVGTWNYHDHVTTGMFGTVVVTE